MAKQYLGDSVYADNDGFNVILTTENGLPTDPSNTIALEPDVIKSLNNYVHDIQQRAEKHHASDIVNNEPCKHERTESETVPCCGKNQVACVCLDCGETLGVG